MYMYLCMFHLRNFYLYHPAERKRRLNIAGCCVFVYLILCSRVCYPAEQTDFSW